MEPEPELPGAASFCLEPEPWPTKVGRSRSMSRLRDLGRQEPEPPKKVAAPQHCLYQHVSSQLFLSTNCTVFHTSCSLPLNELYVTPTVPYLSTNCMSLQLFPAFQLVSYLYLPLKYCTVYLSTTWIFVCLLASSLYDTSPGGRGTRCRARGRGWAWWRSSVRSPRISPTFPPYHTPGSRSGSKNY